MIVETPINTYKTKIKFNQTIYPQCQCGTCSKFYWNALFVGARGSGKTYSAVAQILHYEQNKVLDKDGNKIDIRTFLISPTRQQNEIFNVLKSLHEDDIHDEYTDGILLGIIDEVKKTKAEALEYQEYAKAYKKYSKLREDQLEQLENDELRLLEGHDFNEPKVAFPNIKYKHPPVNILVMDDLLGSDAFSKKSKSIFQNALIKSRHLNIAFQILVQSLKSVPKPVRMNCSIFWIGKFSAMSVILEDLYPEVSGCCTPEEFEMLYKHAVDKPFGALIIDTTKPKGSWFSAGWNTMLNVIKK